MDLMRGEPFTLDELSDEPVIKQVKGEPREFPSQVKQLTMTLAALLNSKSGLRAQAGDTVHDMRRRADLECGCAEYRKAKIITWEQAVDHDLASARAANEGGADDPDWNV